MSKPRIAICITVYERGGQRVVINEQTRLLAERYEFTLFTEKQRAESPAWLSVVEMRPWRSRWTPIPDKALRLELADFDLIHCHDSFAYIWEASKTGKPVAVTSYGNCPGRYRGSIRLKLEYYMSEPIYGMAYNRANRVIAISDYIQNWLVKRYRVHADLCYIGVDIDRFSPGMVTREPAFLYVGELSARKGVPSLIRAFRAWRPKHPDFRLWLVGFGPMSNHLKALSAGGIDYLGFLTEADLIDRYRRCRALVTPSYWEGFGLPILEAFATATPVVARRGYAMTELAGSTSSGILFGRDEELGDALDVALTLPQDVYYEGRRFAEQFTWARSANRLGEIFEELMSKAH